MKRLVAAAWLAACPVSTIGAQAAPPCNRGNACRIFPELEQSRFEADKP